MTDESSVVWKLFLNNKSVVLDFMQTKKSTAMETSGINFSMNEKKAGGFLVEKIMNGNARRMSITPPIIKVAINASVAVSFIFVSLLEA